MVKFTDDSFPANESSLYNDLTRKPSDWLVTHNKSIKWLRPADIKVEKEERLRWSVFNNTKASDIQQGYIGDCWLLSPLSVLAENPTFLHRTIVNKVSNDGYYQVRLCHNGEWKSVEIDDFFPCNFNNSLLFSKAIRKQLWVPLIEKALAKLNGCYENLIGGTNSEALLTLTGKPCVTISLEEDKDTIWSRLLSMKEAGYVITASCGKKEMSDEEYSQLGLTSSHAYSVLGAKIRENQPFVILRNPWGNTAWKEDNNNLINDRKGLFWMNFNDFLVYFYSIDVCKLNYKLHEKRLGAYFSKEKTISFKLEFKETSQVDISLFYKCKHRKETNNLGISFVVIKIGGIGVLAQSKTTYEKFVSLELVLEPGQYLIIPMCLKTFVQNKDSTFCSYNLVVHSTKTFQLEEKSYGITLLVDILSACCKLNMQKLDDAQSKKFSVYKLWTGYMYILVAENLSKNKYLRIELNFNESKNVASTRDELKTLDYIPPRHRQLLHVITPDDVNGGCKIILTNKTFKLKNYLLTKLVMLKIFNKKEKKLIELHSPQSLMI